MLVVPRKICRLGGSAGSVVEYVNTFKFLFNIKVWGDKLRTTRPHKPTASLQFRWLAQPLPHGLFVVEILVFLLFRGWLTKHANHGMRQDAVQGGNINASDAPPASLVHKIT
jgi:hypothetical protein